MGSDFFFTSWHSLLRILVTGGLTYVSVVVILRLSGKRTLAKLNAFDLVVTVALGSTLASALLDKSVTLADSVLAISLLVLLQFIVTKMTLASNLIEKLVKAKPSIVVWKGEILEEQARRERLAHHEIKAAVRAAGLSDLGETVAVVLETDGSLSVIKRGGPEGNALPDRPSSALG